MKGYLDDFLTSFHFFVFLYPDENGREKFYIFINKKGRKTAQGGLVVLEHPCSILANDTTISSRIDILHLLQ